MPDMQTSNLPSMEEQNVKLRRETWKALGWNYFEYVDVGPSPNRAVWRLASGAHAVNHWNRDFYTCDPAEFLPPIESDNGIAMDSLMQWAGSNDAEWRVQSAKHREGATCVVWGKDWTVHEDGTTPSEAICRAIINGSNR